MSGKEGKRMVMLAAVKQGELSVATAGGDATDKPSGSGGG